MLLRLCRNTNRRRGSDRQIELLLQESYKFVVKLDLCC